MIVVSGEPATIELGVTDVRTGVWLGGAMVRTAIGDAPPPGGGLLTVTASWPVTDWSAIVATNVSVVGLT
jgi:hypothetical protein